MMVVICVSSAIIYGNRFYPKLSRKFEFKDKISSIEEQQRSRLNINDEKVKKLGDIFIKYDGMMPMNKRFMEKVKGGAYEQH